MYVYGTQYSLAAFAWGGACIPLSVIYLPVYFKLQITSSYDVRILSEELLFCWEL